MSHHRRRSEEVQLELFGKTKAIASPIVQANSPIAFGDSAAVI
jgi:hypothetical protein